MLTWLIGLPVLVATAAGIGAQLRRRPRPALRVVKYLNMLFLVGAGVLVALAVLASPSSAATAVSGSVASYRGQALIGAAIRGRRFVDRSQHRRRLHRISCARRDERATRDVRPSDGHRRSRRRHRDLRSCHRHHLDRQGLDVGIVRRDRRGVASRAASPSAAPPSSQPRQPTTCAGPLAGSGTMLR